MTERFYLDSVPFAETAAVALFDRERPKQNPILVDFESAQLKFRRRGGVDGLGRQRPPPHFGRHKN